MDLSKCLKSVLGFTWYSKVFKGLILVSSEIGRTLGGSLGNLLWTVLQPGSLGMVLGGFWAGFSFSEISFWNLLRSLKKLCFDFGLFSLGSVVLGFLVDVGFAFSLLPCFSPSCSFVNSFHNRAF